MIWPTIIHQKPSKVGSQKSISFWYRFWRSFGSQKWEKDMQNRYQKLADFWDPTFGGFWWILVGRIIQNLPKAIVFHRWSWSSRFCYKSDLGIKNWLILELKSDQNPSSGAQNRHPKSIRILGRTKRWSKLGKSEAKIGFHSLGVDILDPRALWGRQISKKRHPQNRGLFSHDADGLKAWRIQTIG